MFEKSGKYYADWRDANGRRLRKSFTTKRAALQFEADQRELAHPKKKAQGHQSPRSYAPRVMGTTTTTTAVLPKSSSRSVVPFRRPK